MKAFLDTSVLLAAAGSTHGASRAVIETAVDTRWSLLTSRYCVAEVLANINKLPASASLAWHNHILPRLRIVEDTLVYDKPLAFAKGKDLPVLVTALANKCTFLLTLDRKDFGPFMARPVYGLRVCLPAAFLQYLRERGHSTD